MNARDCGTRAAAALLIALMAACAANPPAPTAALTTAENAISKAEQARAAEFAPVEMRAAHEKLASAREAVQRDDMDSARDWAEQAAVDADLAAAKAEAARSRNVNVEMQKSIQSLQDETRRSSGGMP